MFGGLWRLIRLLFFRNWRIESGKIIDFGIKLKADAEIANVRDVQWKIECLNDGVGVPEYIYMDDVGFEFYNEKY